MQRRKGLNPCAPLRGLLGKGCVSSGPYPAFTAWAEMCRTRRETAKNSNPPLLTDNTFYVNPGSLCAQAHTRSRYPACRKTWFGAHSVDSMLLCRLAATTLT